MQLRDVLIQTKIAHSGMTVGEVFDECIRAGVQGIPYQDDSGKILGRISMRHVLREVCVPRDVLHAAHMLGDEIAHLNMPEVDVRELLGQPAEKYLIDNIPTLTPGSPLVKAIAIMEKYNSSYLFVFDDGYKGAVSRYGIARMILQHR
jgi:predicted transcriptional regulator